MANFDIISVHHGFDDNERELMFEILERQNIDHIDLDRRLKRAKPSRDDWIFQQLFADLIPKAERNEEKWEFLKNDYKGAETVALLKEFILDQKADLELKTIVRKIENIKKN